MQYQVNDFKIVVLESPFAGDEFKNVKYARHCMHDMLLRGEAPYASHLLYTQPDVLDDNNPVERDMGIKAGFAFKHMPNVHTIFYTDLGMSGGMKMALDYIQKHGMTFEIRTLPNFSEIFIDKGVQYN